MGFHLLHCRKNTSHADCECGKGNVLIKIGKADEALDSYTKAVALNPVVSITEWE
jgi:predicted negative regulator of RcsB-dependent stress response